MGVREAAERASERARRAGRGSGGRARLRSALAGRAAMLAGRCVSGSGAGARCGPGPPGPGRGCRALPRAALPPPAEGSGARRRSAACGERPLSRAVPPERFASGRLWLVGAAGAGRPGAPALRGGRGAFPPPAGSQCPRTRLAEHRERPGSCLRGCPWLSASPPAGPRQSCGFGGARRGPLAEGPWCPQELSLPSVLRVPSWDVPFSEDARGAAGSARIPTPGAGGGVPQHGGASRGVC